MERGIVMNKYLVKLMPLGKFFFGGDMTFKVNNKETAFSSYIIHSFMTPQQTSILGMMRFLILSNDTEAFDGKENCIKDLNKANELIGKKGFAVDTKLHAPVNYQTIQKIGPCFLLDIRSQKAFFRAAKDIDLQVEKSKLVHATINMRTFQIPDIKIVDGGKSHPFTGKDSLQGYYVSLDGEKYTEEKLFIEDSRIGINKSYSGKTESEAFYKQISYRLMKNFCFAFEVEVSDSIDLTAYNKQIVKLGADDSSFVFEAERVDKIEYPVVKEELKTVLLSDTYLPDLSACNFQFAITEVRPFRFLSIENSTDAKNYNVKYKSFRSEKRYDLYRAGSVFYFENKDDKAKFCSLIDKYAEFKQIGYNQYC